jgi:hypothetical protein
MKEVLKFKRAMLVEEAKSMATLQEGGERGDDFLMRSMVRTGGIGKGNFSIAFVEHCIRKVDNVSESFIDDYKRSESIFDDNVIKFWQSLPRASKYRQPHVGDIAIFHHNDRRGKLITSGQFAIITEVNRDLSFKTIEGNVVSQFEDEATTSQYNGIRSRIRHTKGTSKMNVLGYFSPWIERV